MADITSALQAAAGAAGGAGPTPQNISIALGTYRYNNPARFMYIHAFDPDAGTISLAATYNLSGRTVAGNANNSHATRMQFTPDNNFLVITAGGNQPQTYVGVYAFNPDTRALTYTTATADQNLTSGSYPDLSVNNDGVFFVNPMNASSSFGTRYGKINLSTGAITNLTTYSVTTPLGWRYQGFYGSTDRDGRFLSGRSSGPIRATIDTTPSLTLLNSYSYPFNTYSVKGSRVSDYTFYATSYASPPYPYQILALDNTQTWVNSGTAGILATYYNGSTGQDPRCMGITQFDDIIAIQWNNYDLSLYSFNGSAFSLITTYASSTLALQLYFTYDDNFLISIGDTVCVYEFNGSSLTFVTSYAHSDASLTGVWTGTVTGNLT